MVTDFACELERLAARVFGLLRLTCHPIRLGQRAQTQGSQGTIAGRHAIECALERLHVRNVAVGCQAEPDRGAQPIVESPRQPQFVSRPLEGAQGRIVVMSARPRVVAVEISQASPAVQICKFARPHAGSAFPCGDRRFEQLGRLVPRVPRERVLRGAAGMKHEHGRIGERAGSYEMERELEIHGRGTGARRIQQVLCDPAMKALALRGARCLRHHLLHERMRESISVALVVQDAERDRLVERRTQCLLRHLRKRSEWLDLESRTENGRERDDLASRPAESVRTIRNRTRD